MPEEAIEAAAKALHKSTLDDDYMPGNWASADDVAKRYWRDEARTALEAAAPFIAAQALREAASNPDARNVGHSGVSVNWLRARADRLEARSV